VDQSSLVKTGHALIEALSQAGIEPRAAVWVYNADADTWRLWIVPPVSIADQRDFYRRVSNVIFHNRDQLGFLDPSDIQFTKDSHPAMRALSRFDRVEGKSDLRIKDNMLNGFFLSDGIILKLAL
jgi:hypothetical protein